MGIAKQPVKQKTYRCTKCGIRKAGTNGSRPQIIGCPKATNKMHTWVREG
jgi:hypothetical protein